MRRLRLYISLYHIIQFYDNKTVDRYCNGCVLPLEARFDAISEPGAMYDIITSLQTVTLEIETRIYIRW